MLREVYKKDKLTFDRLPNDYVSLSLNVDFYENLQLILRKPAERRTFVNALNMILDVQEVCQMNGGRLLCKYGVCRVEKRI